MLPTTVVYLLRDPRDSRIRYVGAALEEARKVLGKTRTPLPYEQQALIQGWTPPKGWMPGKEI